MTSRIYCAMQTDQPLQELSTRNQKGGNLSGLNGSMKQKDAFEFLKKDSGNIFLTGQPGAGKSYLTNKYVDWLLDNGKDFAVTASTGIAALNVNGRTLHSFAGLRNDDGLSEKDIKEIAGNTHIFRRYKYTDVLIIDEISMVSAQLLKNVDIIAKTIRGNTEPFGGIKIVAVGDFFQLPPVKGEYCFTSDVWEQAEFIFCNITEQHRTTDKTFIDILTAIREGTLTQSQHDILKSRCVEDVSEIDDVIRLDTHNKKVDDINNSKLQRISGPPKTYRMTETGDEMYIKNLKKNCLSPEILTLKVGARVICTKNDIEQRFVNGTQGEVVKINNNSVVVRLFCNGTEVELHPDVWEHAIGYGKNKKVIATIHQIPLRLAWAITIHKSQGMTLDRAVIDISRTFASGQSYVALSRVRSLEGVFLQGNLPTYPFSVDEKVRQFYDA